MTPVRAVTAGERPLLRDIERSAGDTSAGIGMAAIAGDEPLQVDLGRCEAQGRAWVAVDGDDLPVACLTAEPVDGN